MAKTHAQITVELLDKASRPAREIAEAIRSIHAAAGHKGVSKFDAAQARLGKTMQPVTARLGEQSRIAYRVGLEMERAGAPARKLAVANEQLARSIGLTTVAMERSARAEARVLPARRRAIVLAEKQARRERILARTRGQSGGRSADVGGRGPNLRGPADQALAGATGLNVGTLGIAGGAYLVGAQLRRATRSAMSFEDTLIEVGKATDTKGAELDGYAQGLLKLSRATGKTKEDLGAMLASAGFAGRPKDELMGFTEYAAKATVAWGTSADETSQGLAEIGNIYEANQKRIEEIGDAINTMADNSASKESDLLEFIRRAGASSRQAGMSAESILAFGAAMKEVGVRNEVAATGFEALLNVMKLGEEFSKSAGDGLKELGIDSTKMRKQFVAKPIETMVGLLEKLNKVSDPLKRAEIMTNLFGKEYQDDIAKLLNALPKINSYLGMMNDKSKSAGSVRLQFAEGMQRDTNKIRQAEQALDALYVKIGDPIKVRLGTIADGFNKLFEDMDKRAGVFERYFAGRDAYRKAAGLPDEKDYKYMPKEGDDFMAPARRKYHELQDFLYGKPGEGESEKRAEEVRRIIQAENEHLARPGQIEADIAKKRFEAQRNASMAPRLTGRQQAMAREAQSRAEAEVTRLEGELTKARTKAAEVTASRAEEQKQVGALRNRVQSADRLKSFTPEGVRSTPGAITPGMNTFGFGPYGTSGQTAELPPAGPAARRVPLPPARPGNIAPPAATTGTIDSITDVLGSEPIKLKVDAAEAEKAKGTLGEIDEKAKALNGQTIAPRADGSGLAPLNAAADGAKTKLSELGGMSVSPTVNASSIQAAEGAVDRLLAKLAQVGGAADAAAGRVASAAAGAGAAASRARSAVASLDRSKQTSMTSSPA
ncbi:phage tail tape measure protein [Methylobacterium hispanicum]|uniref:phage tail tape measure protein n=1 Tax=Methylobacterium hispanicum TaxID=270350 RepID=UPI002F2E5F0E